MSNISKKARNEVKSRKNYETDLNKSRIQFSRARLDFDQASKELSAAQAKVDDARKRLDEARKTIQSGGEHIRIMDLTGASATKQRGNDVSYIIDGNECYVNATDLNNIEMTPWKKKTVQTSSDGSRTETTETVEAPAPIDENSVVDAVSALAAIINEINGTNKTIKTSAINGYEKTLHQLKSLKKEAGLEYMTAISEIKDMARGLNPGNIRDYQFPNWKNQDFKNLLKELSA